MARDLVLEVITKSRNEGLRETARELDSTTKSAEGLSKEFHSLSDRDIPVVEGRTEHLGETFHQAAKEGGLLQKALADARAELKRMEQQLAETGDTTMLKGITSQRSLISRLDKVVKDLVLSPAVAEQAGVEVSSSLFKGISSSFGDMPWSGIVIAAVVPAVVAASPMIGAVLGAAVIGAVGAGGIAGGIFAAKDDPRVESAWSAFAKSVSQRFKSEGASFVQPLVNAAQILDSAFARMNLFKLFQSAAPLVERMAQGIGGFGIAFSDKFTAALEHGMPALNELADLLPTIGGALGEAIDNIARSPNAAEGMRTMVAVIDTALLTAGNIIRWFEDRWDQMLTIIIGTGTFLESKLGWIPGLGDKLRQVTSGAIYLQTGVKQTGSELLDLGAKVPPVSGAMKEFASKTQDAANATRNAAVAVQNMIDVTDKMIAQQTGMTDSRLAWKQAMLDLKQSVKDNGTTLDESTQKGLNNARSIEAMVEAAARQRQELLKNPATAATANSAFQGMIRYIEAFAVKMGFSRAEVDRFIYSLLHIPNKITVGMEITSQFGGGGESHAGGTSHAAKPAVTIPTPHGFAPARAAGGPVWPGEIFEVNERQYLLPAARGRILPNTGGGSAQSTGPLRIAITLDGTGLAANLKGVVRGEGGVDVFFEERR